MALAAWAGAWVGTAGDWRLVALSAVAVLPVAFFARRRRSWPWAAAVSLFVMLLLVAWARSAALAGSQIRGLALQRAVAEVSLTIDSDPVFFGASGPRPGFVSVRGTLVEVTSRGDSWRLAQPVRLLGSLDAEAAWRTAVVGSTVRLSARLEAPEPDDELVAVLRAAGPPAVVAPPSAGLELVERIRGGLRAAMSQEGGERAGLVPALVLGDTSQLEPAVVADFKTTGLTHLSAVSGANLTLLLAFVLSIARPAGLRGWWLRGLSLATVFGFVVLCRSEPSVLRAAAMGLAALAGLSGGHRDRAGVRNLAIAVLVLVLSDPWLARAAGFQLSVCASAGILWWAGRWTDAMSWLPRWLAEALAVPLAAQVATQPLVTAIAGQVSVVGLPANALAGPLVGPATVLGLLTAVAALLVPWLAPLPAWAAGWCVQGIIEIAHRGAAVPGATMAWPTTPAGLAMISAASLALGVGGTALLRRRWLALAVGLAMLVALLRAPAPPGWPPQQWAVVVCDVGQGDALLVRAGRSEAVLVDTGGDPKALFGCLDQLGVDSLPLVVLTHLHADHAGALGDLLGHTRVGHLLLPPTVELDGRIAKLAAARGVGLQRAAPGQVLRVGDAEIGVLAAGAPAGLPQAGEGESAQENDASVVVLLAAYGLRTLVTGDLEVNGQQALVASGANLFCDLFKVPHHGSARQDEAFWAATRARVGLLSVGLRNDYGHPTPKAMRLLGSLGMLTLRTDRQGSLAIGVSDGRLSMVTQK